MSKPIKVLILEDMPSDAELMQRELRNAGLVFEAVLTDTKEGFVEQMEKFQPDIVLSDYLLPSFDAMAALDIVQAKSPVTPFIIISGSIGEELAMEAMRRGATDYFLKDRIAKLGSAVKRALLETQERKQLLQAQDEITNLAKFPEENPDPVLRISADGILLYANPGSRLLLQCLGMKLQTPVSDKLKIIIGQALADGKKKEIEETCGGTIYVLTLSPVLTNAYVNIYGQDITKRKGAEVKLRESEQRFRKVFESSPMAVAITRLADGVLVNVNPAWSAMTGHAAEAAIGHTPLELNSWADPSERTRLVEMLKDRGAVNNYEFNLHQKTGELITGLMSAEAIKFDDQQCMLTMAIDITERKRAVDALQTSEEKWRTLVFTSPDYIALHDREGRYLFLNHYADGYSEQDVIGKSLFDYIAPESRQAYRQAFDACVATRQTQRIEYSAYGARAMMRTYESSLVPVIEQDNVAGIMAIARDITDHKRADETLRAMTSRQEAMLAAIPEIIMEVDTNKTYVWANGVGLEFFGQDVLGREAARYFEGEQKTYQTVQPLFNGADNVTYVESWQRRQDGQKRLLAWRCRALKNERGEVTGALSSAHDITEQTQAADELRRLHEQLQTNYAELELANEGLSASEQELKAADEELRQQLAELNKSREYLQTSEMRYRRLFESAKDGILILNAETGVIEDANPFIKELLGYPREELLGKELWQIGQFKDIVASRENYKELQEKGYVRYEDLPLQAKDGCKKYVEFVSNVYAAGNRNVVQCNIRDITERKQGEDALQASEERLHSFIDNTFIGIYRTTPDGRILMSNPALINMLGYASYEELAQRDLQQEGYEPGYERDEFKQLMEQADQVIGHETPWKRKDGSVVWVRENARCIRDAGGAIQYYEGTVEDITGRKKTEQDLQESEIKYRMMVETINDVVYSINADGLLTYISPAMRSIIDYDPAEIVGKHFRDFVHADDQALVAAKMLKTMAGDLYPIEFRVVARDGSIRWVRSSSRPVRDGATVTGLNGVLSDITVHKRMEQEKQAAEQNLLQSQKMEAIGQLAGGVAHDFNNMLAGMMGNAELLYKKLAANPEQAELIERILKAGEHAANLTKQLLSFARKGQYQMVAVDVHKAIASVAGILANTIDRRIKIRQELRARSATIVGDPTQIENALMNLALNARDAMPAGGELTFATDIVEIDRDDTGRHQYQVEPGRYIMISITDTGTGISDEVRQHIFEPFFTTKEPGKGTGLGLASVYGIAKNHHGSIEVDSRLGQGTVMKVYLPLADASQAALATPAPASIQPGTESLLLVDDEPMIREMAGQMLKGMGYTVATCSDGQEAVDYYREHHATIDLVILDMIMPRLNGREAFLQMRQIDPGVRVLLASGFSADGEAQEVLKLGIRGFIQKPFRMAELSDHIQVALGHAVLQTGKPDETLDHE